MKSFIPLVGFSLLFSACGDRAEDIKAQQVFNIYVSGEYVWSGDCNSGRVMELSSKHIKMGKSQCDIALLTMSNAEPGWDLRVTNCVSDLAPEPDNSIKDIRLSVNEDDQITIHNWFNYESKVLIQCKKE